MIDDYRDLIGQEIGVLDGEGHEYKKIIVKAVKKLGSSWAFSDENGDLYGEEDLNFSYTLTPKGCFFYVINHYATEHNLEITEEEIDNMFEQFAEIMKNLGYVRED